MEQTETMLSKYQVPSLFLGLFLRKLDISDFGKLAESLPWRLPELDGQPRIARNVPQNAPKDAARAVFTSADQRKILEIAPAKLQFRMLPGEIVEEAGNRKGIKPLSLKDSFDAFLPVATKIQSVFSEHYGATATRVGILVEMFTHLGASANQRMQSNILASQNMFGERLQELQVHALAKPTLGERTVNRWIRVKPLRSNDENRSDLAMAVEIDINTLPEDSYDIATSDLEQFLTNVREHIETKVPILHEGSFFEG